MATLYFQYQLAYHMEKASVCVSEECLTVGDPEETYWCELKSNYRKNSARTQKVLWKNCGARVYKNCLGFEIVLVHEYREYIYLFLLHSVRLDNYWTRRNTNRD